MKTLLFPFFFSSLLSFLFFFPAVSSLQKLFPYLVTGMLSENGELICKPDCAAPEFAHKLKENSSRLQIFFPGKKTWTKGSGGLRGLAVGEMCLSHRHSLSLAWSCWPALLEVFWWLPVNSKGLGAYWSVPDSLSVLSGRCWRTGHGNGAPRCA